jgi:hypothetical protein
MRVLLSPYRSRGDVEQLVGLAVRLRARRCPLHGQIGFSWSTPNTSVRGSFRHSARSRHLTSPRRAVAAVLTGLFVWLVDQIYRRS